MKLTKTEWANLSLSVPAPWRDHFRHQAETLGISMNAALCLALKLGGPILTRYVSVMQQQLQDEYHRIGVLTGKPAALPKLKGWSQPERQKSNGKPKR
jgi:hypothetical protein